MSRLPAGTILAVAVVAVSFAAVLVRLAGPVPPAVVALYRLGFASLLLLPWARPPRGAASVPWSRVALAGVLLGVHFLAWFASLGLTSVASSVLLVQTQPLFAGVLAPLFLREATGRTTWLAIGIGVAGAVLVGLADLGGEVGPAPVLGDVLALAAALAAVLYFLVGRSLRERLPLVPYLAWIHAVAAATMLVLALGARQPLSGFPPRTWLIFVLLAVGPSLLGHGLLNLAVRRLPAQAVSLALLGEPVLATLYAALFLGERPPGLFYPGAALVAAGLVVAARGASR